MEQKENCIHCDKLVNDWSFFPPSKNNIALWVTIEIDIRNDSGHVIESSDFDKMVFCSPECIIKWVEENLKK